MWWFVWSLNSATEAEWNKFEEQALEYPMTSIKMCDKISSLLNQSFHSFLQSVADLTLLLPPGSALQQLAIQCFGIKFHQTDHHFLHQSHVFGNISKILSRSDELREQQTDDLPLMLDEHSTASGTKFYSLVEMSGMFEYGNIGAISGPTMSTGRCRFCGAVGDSGLLAMGNVCAEKECQEFAANGCAKIKQCGHPCGGAIIENKKIIEAEW